MRRRFHNRALYLLERLFSRGPWAQLLVVAVIIAGISLGGGVLAYVLEPDRFAIGGAIWWAFLRLTDPGYLGDDEGVAIRTLSTILTVAGYVVFLGALVAILTG
ncbi:MAG TPA: ion channel DMI1, partial [Spirochaetia bacterium]|nr:ion channel DMI1 [Spirochaetia bacterium]